jgi:MFS family permease
MVTVAEPNKRVGESRKSVVNSFGQVRQWFSGSVSGDLNQRLRVLVFAFLVELALNTVSFTVPLYAQALHASQALIGLIGAAYGLSYVFTAMFSPRLYERIGQRHALLFSLACYTAIISLYLVVRDPYLFFFTRLAEGVALGVFWPLADTVPSTRQGATSSMVPWYNTGWSTAALTAPFSAGYLIAMLGLRAPFVSALLMELTELFFVYRYISMPRQPRLKTGRLGLNFTRPLLDEVALPAYTSAFVSSVILTLYPAYLAKAGLAYILIGVLVGSAGTSRTAMFVLSNRIQKLVNGNRLTALGYLCSSFIAVASVTTNATAQLLTMILVGMGWGTLFHSALTNALSTGNTAMKTGLLETSLGAGFFTGPLLGAAVSVFNPNYVYIFTAFLPIGYLATSAGHRARLKPS